MRNNILKANSNNNSNHDIKLFLHPNANSCVASHLIRMEYKAGDIVLQEGENAMGIFVIESGAIDICSKLPGKNSYIVFEKMKPGDFFGEVSSMDLKPAWNSAIAKKDSACYILPANILHALMLVNPSSMLDLIDPMSFLVSGRIRGIIEKIRNEKLILPSLCGFKIKKNNKNEEAFIKQKLNSNYLNDLHKMPIFRKFEIKQIKSIVSHFEILKFPKNTLIIEEGGNSEDAFYVIKGALQTFINIKNKVMKLTVIGPGSTAFLMAFIDEGVSPSSCFAREETIVLRIDKKMLASLEKSHRLLHDRLKIRLYSDIPRSFRKFMMHYLFAKSIKDLHLF